MGKIKDLPLLERPREKALRYGINTLSNADLLAILIGSGTKNLSALDIAYNLLSFHNGLNNLARTSLENLTQQKGVNQVSALRILACFTLAQRLYDDPLDKEYNKEELIKNIAKKYQLILKDLDQEQMHIICLSKRYKIIKEKLLYVGTQYSALTDPNDILKEALICQSKHIILLHNHPNGNAFASDQDIEFSKNLALICKRFDLDLFDHLIVAGNQVVSMFNNLE